MKNDFILIKELNQEMKTESGIIIPQEKHSRLAKVIAVPDNCDICVGDLILKTVGNETTFNINGEEVKSLHKDKIFVVIDNESQT
jgi:co-chaperonin GroES (HSP10)